MAAEEPRVLCIVNNGNNANDKKILNWPASTPCSDLIADVGKKFGLPDNAFELVYDSPISSSDDQRQVLFTYLLRIRTVYCKSAISKT